MTRDIRGLFVSISAVFYAAKACKIANAILPKQEFLAALEKKISSELKKQDQKEIERLNKEKALWRSFWGAVGEAENRFLSRNAHWVSPKLSIFFGLDEDGLRGVLFIQRLENGDLVALKQTVICKDNRRLKAFGGMRFGPWLLAECLRWLGV